MRKGLLSALGIGVFGVAPLMAQTPPPTASILAPTVPAAKANLGFSDLGTAPAIAPSTPPAIQSRDLAPCSPSNDCFRYWASADYLLWWVKSAPYPIPIVTTGDPNVGFPRTSTAGAIGQPGTQVLLGNGNAGFGAFSGGRLTIGGWLDNCQTIGIEGTGFLLERRTNQFAAASNGAGNPPLYFPAFNVVAGQERALQIADPLRGFAGDVSVTSQLQLWGTELNGILNLTRRPGLQVNLLMGFRYLDLQESLRIHNTTTDLVFRDVDVSNDYFGTRNQFYGGQIGTRMSWQRDRLFVDLTGKLALGSTHQVVNISGDTTQTALPGGFAPTPGTFPAGVFTAGTNSGQQSSNQFTVVPALQLNVGYQVTTRVRIFAGYDVMYWNQVVRPGDQMDHNVNPSQHPVFGTGALVGPAAPVPLFNRTDFWAQGVNFGMQFRF